MVCAGIGGGLLVRVHGLQPTHRPPRVSDSAESDTPATCDAANPITPGTAPTAESTTPSDAATPAVSAAKSMRPASTQPTRPAPPRPADAHTSPMTKSSNVTPNMSQSISSLSQTSRSTPPSCGCIAIRNQILRRNRQLRDAKLASRVFYDNRKTLEIPTIPRVSNGADDGSRTLRPLLEPCPTAIKSLKFQPFTLIGKGLDHVVFLKVLPQCYLRALAISRPTASETMSKSLSKRSA